MPAVAPLGVDRLIGCDCVEPGAELPTLLERISFYVDLQEGGLEYVFGQRRVAQEPPQIVIQFSLVARDQVTENRWIARLAIGLEQLLIAEFVIGFHSGSRRLRGQHTLETIRFFLGLSSH